MTIIDDPHSNANVLGDRLAKSSEQIDQYSDQLGRLVQLDLNIGRTDLLDKIDKSISSQIDGFIFKYASLEAKTENYAAIAEMLGNKNLFLHLSGVRKSFRAKSMKASIYLPQMMPLFGFDSIGLYSVGFGNPEGPIVFGRAKRFDAKTYRYSPIEKIYKSPSVPMNCSCPVDKEVTYKEFMAMNRMNDTIKHANSIHDLVSNYREFQLEALKIANGSLFNMLQTKEYARQFIAVYGNRKTKNTLA